jgi:lipopolysaccharide export system protein LptC
MSVAKSGPRFRFWVILAVMTALALGSFWVLEVMRRSASDFIPTTARTEPDFYVEKFSYVKMSETGDARYHVSGDRLTHNPVDDSYDIQQPVVKKLSNTNQAPMTVRAERAQVNSDSSEVHLYDNVQMDRPAMATSQPLHVTSNHMLVLPDDDAVKTDQPVEITMGPSKLTGVGMVANNATREFHLSSNVHGTYQAAGR